MHTQPRNTPYSFHPTYTQARLLGAQLNSRRASGAKLNLPVAYSCRCFTLAAFYNQPLRLRMLYHLLSKDWVGLASDGLPWACPGCSSELWKVVSHQFLQSYSSNLLLDSIHAVERNSIFFQNGVIMCVCVCVGFCISVRVSFLHRLVANYFFPIMF